MSKSPTKKHDRDERTERIQYRKREQIARIDRDHGVDLWRFHEGQDDHAHNDETLTCEYVDCACNGCEHDGIYV